MTVEVETEVRIFDDQRPRTVAECRFGVLTIDSTGRSNDPDPVEFSFESIEDVDVFCGWLRDECLKHFDKD